MDNKNYDQELIDKSYSKIIRKKIRYLKLAYFLGISSWIFLILTYISEFYKLIFLRNFSFFAGIICLAIAIPTFLTFELHGHPPCVFCENKLSFKFKIRHPMLSRFYCKYCDKYFPTKEVD